MSETKPDYLAQFDAGLTCDCNDLCQTFRTIAATAGVSDIDAKLLMNHATLGVNADYITRHKLLEDHLRRQQQAISSAVFVALGASPAESHRLQNWLGH